MTLLDYAAQFARSKEYDNIQPHVPVGRRLELVGNVWPKVKQRTILADMTDVYREALASPSIQYVFAAHDLCCLKMLFYSWLSTKRESRQHIVDYHYSVELYWRVRLSEHLSCMVADQHPTKSWLN